MVRHLQRSPAMRHFWLLALLAACGVTDDDDGGGGGGGGGGNTDGPVADVRCATPPDAGPAEGFRHSSSDAIASGDPHHRGIDLVTTTDAATQTLTGKITYGPTDKDLEDEDIDLFACTDEGWQSLGTAVTNGDGRFTLELTGDARLPVGQRDLYLSIAGDRTGAYFLALVAPAGTRVLVSDVDGTLTPYENAYPEYLASGDPVGIHAGAPAAFSAALARDIAIVYLTARGDRFTQDTRDWLATHGMPRGPLRMPSAIITLPGDETVEFKTAALASLAGYTLTAGIGNRASDVRAYTNAGLPPSHIFINLPEYEDELAADISAGAATFFDHYDEVRTLHVPNL